ncbi:MAG: GNAT family N-acetyltransferase [Nanoarchaeota archaeon]
MTRNDATAACMQDLVIDTVSQEEQLCDLAQLKALDDAIVTGGNPDQDSALDKLLRLDEYIDFHAAYIHQEAYAYAQTREPQGRSLELEWVFVHPSFRRAGMGRKLLAHVVGYAHQKGVCELSATFGQHCYTEAISFLQESGFTVEKQENGLYIATRGV